MWQASLPTPSPTPPAPSNGDPDMAVGDAARQSMLALWRQGVSFRMHTTDQPSDAVVGGFSRTRKGGLADLAPPFEGHGCHPGGHRGFPGIPRRQDGLLNRHRKFGGEKQCRQIGIARPAHAPRPLARIHDGLPCRRHPQCHSLVRFAGRLRPPGDSRRRINLRTA